MGASVILATRWCSIKIITQQCLVAFFNWKGLTFYHWSGAGVVNFIFFSTMFYQRIKLEGTLVKSSAMLAPSRGELWPSVLFPLPQKRQMTA